MGFFDDEENAFKGGLTFKGMNIDTLRRHGCGVCPLALQTDTCHPQMEPAGADKPLVYMLGEFPSRLDDRKDRHFAGQIGELVKVRIPRLSERKLRWNYVVRTRVPPDRKPKPRPTPLEVECCRPSIVKDIEGTKPRAIIGFGPVVLDWVIGQSRILDWAGRRIPVKVGKHTCWFYPMPAPDAIMDSRRYQPRDPTGYGSDLELKFAFDMARTFKEIEGLRDPIVHDREEALRNTEFVTGHGRRDLDRVLDFIDYCYDETVVGLDYETAGLRPYTTGAKILTASLGAHDRAMAFPFYHRSRGWTDAQLATVRKAWRKFLKVAQCRKVSHNLAFEMEWSAAEFGVDTAMIETWECSMSQAFLLDERPANLNLGSLCLQHFGIPIKDLFQQLDRKQMEKEKLETILQYNAVDAKYHRLLFNRQAPLVKRDALLECYQHHRERMMATVRTTMKGVPVDQRVVEANFKMYTDECDATEKQILALDIARQFKRREGRELRPSNNNDVVYALQTIAGITLEKTKNKKRKKELSDGEVRYSTTEENLVKLKHPLAKLIVKWRKSNKLLGTYVLPVRVKDTTVLDAQGRKGVHKTQLFPDGLLHPIVKTCKVRTWRTSSEEPNIQNWPTRGPSKVIRKQIAVDDEHVIVAIDYAGIQARNVGMESLDPGLLKHYWAHYDIHFDWLDRLLRRVPTWRPKQDVGEGDAKTLRKEFRSIVKNKFVFPSFFGAVGKTVADYLGIAESTGCDLSEEFFDEFPIVKKWHEKLRAFYQREGYVTGLSGFKRRAPIEINQLINAPIQADEALIVCGAWARLCRLGDERFVPNWMIHDDLTFIWEKKKLDQMLEVVVPVILEQVHEWEKVVPMEIEVKVGQNNNWCDLKEIAVFETVKGGGWHEIVKDKKEKKRGSDGWDYKVGQEAVPPSRQTEAKQW